MKAADLENLTPEELQALAQSVQAALEKHQKEQARHVLAEARRLAASVGYEAAFTKAGKTARAASQGKVAPKYRNPDNPQEVWSGRGRQPLWVQRALAAGTSLDRLAIIPQGEAPSRKTA
jgi:DNA-binding protein H-NS